MFLIYLGELLPPKLSERLFKLPFVMKWANRRAIEEYCDLSVPRPRPFSLASSYTSWKSLTDKSFTGRHLPADESQRPMPDIKEVSELWARGDGEEIPSTDTSVLFGYFAQWFTDSFLRTSLDDRRKNTSNHDIDLCQIYGLNEEKTDILRLKKNGKLRYQVINGEIYPPYLFSSKVTAKALQECDGIDACQALFGAGAETEDGSLPNFSKLHELSKMKVMYRSATNEQLKKMFVTGLEHGNSSIGYTSMNTLFLREHNRICDVLIAAGHGKGMAPNDFDDYIFEVTRNIIIVLFLKIMLKDYVRQAANVNIPFALDPKIGTGKPWKRSNWISIEFNLLYRWHSLIPDHLIIDENSYSSDEFRNNPKLVIEKGISKILSEASLQKAGKIGLRNTPKLFFTPMPMVEKDIITNSSIQERTVKMARDANLQPFNAYRKAFGMKPYTTFEQLSDDQEVISKLKELYHHVDDVEFMVGIFAEKHRPNHMLGELMFKMVAYDAFTHAFSNPLVSPEIFNSNTFTKKGMQIIEDTNSFEEIVIRNSVGEIGVPISFSV